MSDKQNSEHLLSEINRRLKNIEKTQHICDEKLDKINKCIQGLLSKTEDIEKRLAKPIYQRKLNHTLVALRDSR